MRDLAFRFTIWHNFLYNLEAREAALSRFLFEGSQVVSELHKTNRVDFWWWWGVWGGSSSRTTLGLARRTLGARTGASSRFFLFFFSGSGCVCIHVCVCMRVWVFVFVFEGRKQRAAAPNTWCSTSGTVCLLISFLNMPE